MPPHNPKTLFEICVEASAATLPRNVAFARLLPPALKTAVLELACAKGTVDEGALRALLHGDTPTLSLGEGVRVDDAMLGVVAGRCRKLVSLNLCASGGDKDAVTAAGLLELFPTLGGSLRELHLRRCPAVDDPVVAEAARCFPRLRVLDVGGCRQVTDRALYALKDLEGLVSLNASGTKVENVGVMAVADGGSRTTLRELIVDGCHGVNDFGVKFALGLCPNLAYFSFRGCPVSGSFAEVDHPNLRDISWTVS